jgi:hypothetical protein
MMGTMKAELCKQIWKKTYMKAELEAKQWR